MGVSPGYIDHIMELLADLGGIEVRRMFGAAGVFRNDVMFAVIDEDVLYLKADEAFAEELKAQGASKWVYSKRSPNSRRVSNNWSLPDEAADDPELAVSLARRAYEIAASKKRRGRGGK